AASLCIILPTMWLGATFPLAVKVYSNDISERAVDTGTVYAANTCGALLGALVAGFVLIPEFGARNSLIVIASLFLLCALVLWRQSERPPEPNDRPFPIAAIGGGLMFAAAAALLPRQIIVNFNMQRTTQPNIIYHGEGIAHTVDIIRTPTN